MSILAIDQGTTSTRALRVGDDGHPSIVHVAGHQQYYPQPGWVEHDPYELLAGIEACLAACPDAAALGIDNQGESCLAWHADTKQPSGPVIVWQDKRTQTVTERLHQEGHEARVLEISGLPLDPYFSASKLAWILENHADAQSWLRQGKLRLGTTDAFFLDCLTGRFVTDITTASRTSLMNLQTGQWDVELCTLFKVPMETLPEIVSTTGNFGSIERPGIDMPVTASVVDQQASLFGHGCRHSGDAKITFGTGAFALALIGDRPLRSPEQGLLPTIAWQLCGQAPVYALDGGVYCAGSAIDWGRQLGLFNDYANINQFATGPAIDRNLVFVPSLSGLACPHWDRNAAGAWIGLSLGTDKSDLMQSILEGVAMRAAEVISAMDAITEVGDSISIDGGVSVNPYFCQFLANTLQRQIVVKPIAELTAIGTAQLAGAHSVVMMENEGAETCYQPDVSTDYRERFERAVSCVRNWHR